MLTITDEIITEALLLTNEQLALSRKSVYSKESGKSAIYSFAENTKRLDSQEAKSLILNLINVIGFSINYNIPENLNSLNREVRLGSYSQDFGSARGYEKYSGVSFSPAAATQLTLYTYIAYPNVTLIKERWDGGKALYNNRKRVLKYSLDSDSAELQKAVKYTYTSAGDIEEEGVENSDWQQASFSYIKLADSLRSQIKELVKSDYSEIALEGDVKYCLQLFFNTRDEVVINLDLRAVRKTSDRLGLVLANKSVKSQTENLIVLLHSILGDTGTTDLSAHLETETSSPASALNILINPWYLSSDLLSIVPDKTTSSVISLDLIPARTELEGSEIDFAGTYVGDAMSYSEELSLVSILNSDNPFYKRLYFSMSNVYGLSTTITESDTNTWLGKTVLKSIVGFFSAARTAKDYLLSSYFAPTDDTRPNIVVKPIGDSVRVQIQGSDIPYFDIKMRIAPTRVSSDMNAEFFHLVESVSIAGSLYTLDSIYKKTEGVKEAILAVLLASAYRNTVIVRENGKLKLGFYLVFSNYYEDVINPNTPFNHGYTKGYAGSDNVKAIFFKG